MATSVYVVCDVNRPPVKLTPSSAYSSEDDRSADHSSPRLRAKLPSDAFADGQLIAFVRTTHSENDDDSGLDDGNSADLYYEATLRAKEAGGKEHSLGKLSKTTPCIHWKGNIAANPDDRETIIVEADWQEYRIHRTEVKENAVSSAPSTTISKTPNKPAATPNLKRKRSPLVTKDEQRQQQQWQHKRFDGDFLAGPSAAASAAAKTPTSKKTKAASLLSPAARKTPGKLSTLSPAARKTPGKLSSKTASKTTATPASSEISKMFGDRKKATPKPTDAAKTSAPTSTPTSAPASAPASAPSSAPAVYNPNTVSGSFLNMLLAAKSEDEEEKEREEKKVDVSTTVTEGRDNASKEERPPVAERQKKKLAAKPEGEKGSGATSNPSKFLVQALLNDDEDEKDDGNRKDDDEFELVSSGVLDPSPSVRWGHSQCLVTSPSGSHVVVIGGQTVKNAFCRDATWLYDPSFDEWEALETGSGGSSSPGMRMGHSAVFDADKNCIFVYGGSKNTRWFKDMHMLSLDRGGWQELKTSGEAPTRAYHSAVLHQNEIWIFGGIFPNPGTEPDGCSNSIEVYSATTGGWYTPEVTGMKPQARSGHSAALLGDKMLVFGGWDMPTVFNDVFIFDLTFAEWTKPDNIQGSPPSPRCWHATALLTHLHPRLFIHGGFNGDRPLGDTWILDLPTGLSHSPSATQKPQWTKIVLPDVNLNARAGHSAVSLMVKGEEEDEEEEEERLVLFGGGNNNGTFFNTTTVIRAPSVVN